MGHNPSHFLDGRTYADIDFSRSAAPSASLIFEGVAHVQGE
ncbi:MAG TPA: hypothetical protein VGN16_16735 [Acidobacteriaceae bacterium]|jgi:hypothetical protein